MREKNLDIEFLLFRISRYSNLIRIFIPQISVFSPNMGKYILEKFSYLDTFQMVETGKRALSETTAAVAIAETYAFINKFLMDSTTIIFFI